MMGQEQTCINCGGYLPESQDYHIDCEICGVRNINEKFQDEESEYVCDDVDIYSAYDEWGY